MRTVAITAVYNAGGRFLSLGYGWGWSSRFGLTLGHANSGGVPGEIHLS